MEPPSPTSAIGGMLMFFSGCRSARGLSELERKSKALRLHIMTFSNPEPPLDKWPCDFVASVDMEQHNASANISNGRMKISLSLKRIYI
jgi:hypothetical protein